MSFGEHAMKQSLLVLLCVAMGALPSHAENAPQMRVTNPVTGQSTVRSMTPLADLPKSKAVVVSRISDSVFANLYGAIAQADTTRMAPQLPQAMVRGKSLEGAVVGPDGKVSLSVSTSAADRDLTGTIAWALWYVETYGESKIQFSLDPKSANDFAQGNDARYSPAEALKPFSIGRDLYEADMDLKYYALGYERDGANKVRAITSPPPGYRSRLQITADLFAKGIERQSKVMARLWIVCDSVFATTSDKSMRIDSVQVRIHARQMGVTNGNELADIADADTVTALFTHWFQANYFQLAQKHPELEAVVQNAKALAIARWMVSHKAQPDASWAQLLLPTVDSAVVSGPAMVRRDTLTRERPNGKDILVVQLAGGVEVGAVLVENRVSDPAPSKGKTAQLQASLSNGKNTLRPLKDDWLKNVRSRKAGGREWTIGADGLPLASVDGAGRKIHYKGTGRHVTAASSVAPNAHASVNRTENGYSLDYQDHDRFLSSRYDVQGRRTDLWEFPARQEIPSSR